MITENWKQVSRKFGNRSTYTEHDLELAEDAALRTYKLARAELYSHRVIVAQPQMDHDHHIINGALSLLLLGYEQDFKTLADETFEQGRTDVRYKPVGLALDMARRVLGQTKGVCNAA